MGVEQAGPSAASDGNRGLWPVVYGDDLRTVVGQMVPGKGFVPVGVDPATVPTFAVEVGPSVDPGSTGSPVPARDRMTVSRRASTGRG